MKKNKYRFTNDEFGFVSGLILSTEEKHLEFQIYGTHEKSPINWEPIAFKAASNGNMLLLDFRKPVNYFYFHLEFSGASIPYKNIQKMSVTPISNDEIFKILKTKKLLVHGLARNCEKTIKKKLQIIQQIGELFDSYKIKICENDSTDGTRNLIDNLKHKFPLETLYFENLDKQFSLRTERLSFCRNSLLRLSSTEKSDYTAVIDLDDVFNSFSIESFLSSFEFEQCWDGCFPIMEPYYDIWALRHPQIMPSDFKDLNGTFPIMLGDKNIYKLTYLPIRELNFKSIKGLLEVDSAFGGFAIYKSNIFYEGVYGGKELGKEICEHVLFNKSLKKLGAKLFINPKFILE